jgi:hypothetical protein
MASQIKPVLPHMAVGAALGAASGYGESQRSNEPLRQRIEALEAQPDLGARDTMSLAQLRARHTVGEFTAKHPGVTTALGALGGAQLGRTMGPGIVDAARSGLASAKGMGQDVKELQTLFSGGA